MSRICGFVAGPATSVALAQRLLRASSLNADWTAAQTHNGLAALGWCGWKSPGIHEEGGVLVSLDGRIFNRAELSRTETDAACIADLHNRLGFEALLLRINADFGLILADPASGTVWAARDRFGLKPLYYTLTAQGVAIASRLGALLMLPGVSHEPNRQFVALMAGSHYRTFDHDPEQTPFAAVRQLPAGCLLEVRNGTVRQRRYWKLEPQDDFRQPLGEMAERYKELLLDAVRIRLSGSDRPAFTLSGGMDSSSVLSAAVAVSGDKQHAFSTVYEDRTYDESADIRTILDAMTASWTPVSVGTPDLLNRIDRMIAVNDEPVATATWLSHAILCEAAGKAGMGTLFGGLGGDELNAGEYEHFFFFFADLRAAGAEPRLRREIEGWIRHHDHPIFHKTPAVMEEAMRRLVDLNQPGRCLPDRRRLARYQHTVDRRFWDLTAFEPAMEGPFTSYLKNRTYQDLSRETIPCCVRAEDRNATACGLDRVLPFLDHRLVEFMFRVPSALKFEGGVGKIPLREAMKGVVPEATRTRIKKTGWNAPAHVWFSGPGAAMMRDLIGSQSFHSRGIYVAPAVEQLLSDHERIVSTGALEDNHMMFFWQMANLELWLRQVDGLESKRASLDKKVLRKPRARKTAGAGTR